MQEEIFGPILPVLTVDDVDEAIAFVNERDKPLALYVFADDDGVANACSSRRAAAARASTRRCSTSPCPTCRSAASAPSGMGAYHGKASFETFSHAKSVLRKRRDPTRRSRTRRTREGEAPRRFLYWGVARLRSEPFPTAGATPLTDDTLVRACAEAVGDLTEMLGRAGGQPTVRTDEFVAHDSHARVPLVTAAVPPTHRHHSDDPEPASAATRPRGTRRCPTSAGQRDR